MRKSTSLPVTNVMCVHRLLLVFLLFIGAFGAKRRTDNSTEDPLTSLQKVTSQLARQLMLQQLYVEEMTRSSLDSGIKHVRRRKDGDKPYYTATHISRSVAAIHDHSDHVRTVGMGEFIAVLNGVEFRTRHNDYKLKMPSTTSGEYHATEDIPFPEVPPEVLQRTSVDEQIAEMRKWFEAWQTGNHTVRDYRKYFRPNLCYLEGAWSTDTAKLDEPFDSDRHHLEASSWFDLQELIRFTSYTGTKNLRENYAYLPTTIVNITDYIPIFGQWNYRILCHPIRGDLDISVFKPIDNLANRLVHKNTLQDYVGSRAARFRLDPDESDDSFRWSILDELMYQIPGKNNYNASIYDDPNETTKVTADTEEPLNSAFYHSAFKVLEKDAMGEKLVFRGFADRNLYVAATTQPRVAGMSIKYCRNRRERKRGQCSTISRKMSYAVPLEIIYTTPLQSWNPYGLEFKGDANSQLGRTVKEDGTRNGKMTPEKAFNGTNSKAYYVTPNEFFTGGEVGKGSADTNRKSVGVLDPSGNVQAMRSAGIRIHLPNIPGVGVIRTRYPIMPVSTEGDPVWKELEALRDLVMDMKSHIPYFPTTPPFPEEILNSANKSEPHQILETSDSNPEPFGLHTHTVELNEQQLNALKRRQAVEVKTSEDNGHFHSLTIVWHGRKQQYRIVHCGRSSACFDGHSRVLNKVPMEGGTP